MTEQLQVQPQEDRVHPTMRVLQSEKTKAALLAIAPKCDPEVLMARARLALVENSYLGNCSPESLLLSLKRAASSGFEPSAMGRDWYLVPRYNKKTRCTEAQFQIGWMGYVSLAKEADLPIIRAEIVYENDVFRCSSDERGFHLTHDFEPLSTNRGKPVGCYSMTQDKKGKTDYEFMTAAEVHAIRARSTAWASDKGPSGPWVTDELEMWKKTVLRRHSKRWRLSTRGKEVVMAENEEIDADAPPAVKTARYKLEEPAQLPPPQSDNDGAGEPQPDPSTGEFKW